MAHQGAAPCIAHLIALLSALPENGAFFCNECDCRFSEEASLKRHSLQVHSDKPYKCDRCQASFRYKGNLASHKTVHTGTMLATGTTYWGGCGLLGMWVFMTGFVPGAVFHALCHKLCLMGRARCFSWHCQGPLGRAPNPGTGRGVLPGLTAGMWSSSSFAVKCWAPPFLKASCKMHGWEQMRGLQVTLW